MRRDQRSRYYFSTFKTMHRRAADTRPRGAERRTGRPRGDAAWREESEERDGGARGGGEARECVRLGSPAARARPRSLGKRRLTVTTELSEPAPQHSRLCDRKRVCLYLRTRRPND
ncbi:hypothetical protein SRHO_G00190280 [Serrasalmus rhombeus]